MIQLPSVTEIAGILVNQQHLVERYRWEGRDRRSAVEELATNLGYASRHGISTSLIRPKMPGRSDDAVVPYGHLVREVDLTPEERARYEDPGYVVGQIATVRVKLEDGRVAELHTAGSVFSVNPGVQFDPEYKGGEFLETMAREADLEITPMSPLIWENHSPTRASGVMIAHRDPLCFHDVEPGARNQGIGSRLAFYRLIQETYDREIGKCMRDKTTH